MYDKLVIEKHLTALLLDLKNLEKYKNVTEEEIKGNTDLLWILERGIYLSLQNIFDCLSHIISASLNYKHPDLYVFSYHFYYLIPIL